MTAIALAELILVAVCAWPLARLVLNPGLARLAPLVPAALALALGAAGALLVWLGVHVPMLLHPVAAGVGVVAAGAAWRARPRSGGSRHLPPGSLSLTRSIEAIGDRHYYARQFERYGPIFKMAQFHEGVICLLGHARWHDLMRTHRQELGPSLQAINDDVQGGFLRYMDEEHHRVYGRLLRAALAEPVVGAAEPVIRQAARLHLSRAAAASAVAGSVCPEAYLEAIVVAAFARALCGIDPARDVDDFRALESAHAALEPAELGRRLSATERSAFQDLGTLLRRRASISRAEAATGETAASAISELVRLDPAMPDPTCVDNLIMMLKIGSSNVLGLLRWLFKILGDHPAWLHKLRTELDSGAAIEPGQRLSDRIVMETLRLEQSEYLYRRVRTRFSHQGFDYPAGWQVRLCVKETHRSGDIFEQPDRFDPDRFLARRFTKTEYSPFGTGSHACNGVDLTNLVCRTTVEELAQGFELTLAKDGPPERELRHWSHWRPSSDLRVTLSPRVPAPSSK